MSASRGKDSSKNLSTKRSRQLNCVPAASNWSSVSQVQSFRPYLIGGGGRYLVTWKINWFGTVADNFGVAAYAIYLFFLTIWWGQVWGDASACPYTHMEDMVEGKTSPRVVALKTWAQLMGGCCVFRVVQLLWWLELADTHEGRAFAPCTADLQVCVIM